MVLDLFFFILALHRLGLFQQQIRSNKFSALRSPSSLQFLFRFPGECKSEWEQNRNFEYPFESNNIDYCLDKHRRYCYHYWKNDSNEKMFSSLLIFTPALQLTYRKVHNHSFSTLKSTSIEWTCDHIHNSEQIFNSLIKFHTVKNLTINSEWIGTKMQSVSLSYDTNNLMKWLAKRRINKISSQMNQQLTDGPSVY